MTKERFKEIYCGHYAAMYRLAKSMLYDEEESRDVVSEVFARLLQGGIFPDDRHLDGYLLSSVRNRCRDVISHKQIRERVRALYSVQMQQGQMVADCDDDDRLEQLLRFVDEQLPPLSQRIFRLRFLSEMTYAEVAEAVGVSRVTVYHHLSQSLQKVKAYFETLSNH